MSRTKKPWNKKREDKQRKKNQKLPRHYFLIVCEGKKTEPNYFNAFPVPKGVVTIEVLGIGYVTESLVNKAVEFKEKKSYDQVWSVFDRDDHPLQGYNKAFTIARENNIKIAYSNQSFELWYLLHYIYIHSSIHRKDCIKNLENHLKCKYEKKADNLYEILKPMQDQAIKHAQRLLKEYNPRNARHENPSTTVHHLVEELNKFIEE